MAASMAGCADTEKPVFQQPTTFTINTPAFQDEYLATTGDMDNKSTFMLYCSQPDYGFAAKANYSAQVSLSPTFIDATDTEDANYVELTNQDINSGAMRIRTYDLAVAMTTLLGFESQEDYDNYLANGGATVMPLYFRGVCEIGGVSGSYIVSSNVVSYNKVGLSFAIPTAGIIYIVGDVNNFTAPEPSNAEFYADYECIEPEIGCKLYAGTFLMPNTESVHSGATGPDYTTQWRFFTELSGWNDASKMVGSNEADFYVEPITDLFVDGQYSGTGVYGKGNWGVLLEEDTWMTVVVSLEVKDKPKVWFRYGKWDVQPGLGADGLKEPVFSASAD